MRMKRVQPAETLLLPVRYPVHVVSVTNFVFGYRENTVYLRFLRRDGRPLACRRRRRRPHVYIVALSAARGRPAVATP